MSRKPLDRPARVTVLLLCLAWTVDYFDRFLVNLTLPHIGAEFGLDNTGQGLVLSAFFLAYMAFQIPGGLLADRFGAVRVMLVAVVAWSMFTAGTGAVGSFAALLLVRFLFGAAEGVFPGGSIKALSERTEPAQRMTANGWMQSSSAFAVVLVPLFAAPVVSAWGWRAGFFAAAGLGVLVWVALWRWLPPALPSPASSAAGRARSVLRSSVLWRFAAMFFGFDVIVLGLNSWVPKYLQDERGLSVTDAGAVALVPVLIGGVAVVVGGRWSDRLEGRHRRIVVPAMAACAPCLVAMATIGDTAPSPALFVVLLAAASLFAGLCYMPIFAVPLRSLPPQLTGSAAAMIVFGGQAAGIVTPAIMGVLTDHFSYRVAFVFLVTGAVLAAALALRTPQTSAAFRAAVEVRA